MARELFNEWLLKTQILQRTIEGRDVTDLTPDERADYFRTMGFALIVELGELSQEIGWKSWAKDRSLSRETYIKELVDVLHFTANLAVLAGITDQELEDAYLAKMSVNRDRAHSKTYDGRVENKCSSCRRSFDDVERSSSSVDSLHHALCSLCVPTEKEK